jgi:lysine biosynthesis protein LysW
VSKSKQVKCPMCREYLEIEDTLQKGDVVYCSDCEEELKIVRLDPPRLKRIVEILEVYKTVQKDVPENVPEDDAEAAIEDDQEDYADSGENDFEDRFAGFEDMYGDDFE